MGPSRLEARSVGINCNQQIEAHWAQSQFPMRMSPEIDGRGCFQIMVPEGDDVM